MKKKTAWLLALLLLLTGFGPALAAPKTVTVGTTNPMNGMFFTEMWGNAVADMDVRELVHGYPTVAWLSDGTGKVNPTVVKAMEVSDDTEGNRVYDITLSAKLTYNNGNAVTAADYAFSLLLQCAPAVKELGGNVQGKSYILGADDYAAGKANTLAGVRLLGRYRFSITVAKENLPYFYDLAYAHVMPYPIGVIAPGLRVKDDGEGVYLSGEMTAQMLQKTLFDEKTGYVSHPKVSCGPYTLKKYDAIKGEAALERNTRYVGDWDGVRPRVRYLVYKNAANGTMADEMKKGGFDILTRVSHAESIDALSQAEGIAKSVYPRRGLAYIAFACERAGVSSPAARRAVAAAMDRDALISSFLGGKGVKVNGYFGVGQWMAKEMSAETDALDMPAYAPESAAEAFKAAGIKELSLAMAKGGEAGLEAAELLKNGLEKAGVRLNVVELDAKELFSSYYSASERAYDMYYMASNFYAQFDPSLVYHTDESYFGVWNTSHLKNEELYAAALQMRRTEPGARDAYLAAWLAFQKLWVNEMPAVPLYSNDYYDFSLPSIENYAPETVSGWAVAIQYVR